MWSKHLKQSAGWSCVISSDRSKEFTRLEQKAHRNESPCLNIPTGQNSMFFFFSFPFFFSFQTFAQSDTQVQCSLSESLHHNHYLDYKKKNMFVFFVKTLHIVKSSKKYKNGSYISFIRKAGPPICNSSSETRKHPQCVEAEGERLQTPTLPGR